MGPSESWPTALALAVDAHTGQRRKQSDIPYISHPVGVAFLLRRYQCDDVTIAAALLHDVVEDTALTLAELTTLVGPRVTAIVAACSEIEGDWETRKLAMVASIRVAPLPAKLVVAADKVYNVWGLAAERARTGRIDWARFSRGAGRQAWYYRAMAGSVVANVPAPARHPLFDALADGVEAVFTDIIADPPPNAGE